MENPSCVCVCDSSDGLTVVCRWVVSSECDDSQLKALTCRCWGGVRGRLAPAQSKQESALAVWTGLPLHTEHVAGREGEKFTHTHIHRKHPPFPSHIYLSCCVHKLLFLSFAVFFSKNISKNIVFQGWVLFMLYAKSIDLIHTTPTHKRRYLRASLCAHTFPCLFMTLHSVDYVDTLRFKPTTDVLISSWFFLDTPSSCWPVGWICSMTLPDEALMCGCECVSVFRSRICVWEWWRRRTICLAECGCAWYLGVAALQMFWLFLALLCFRFPLVCLEVEGLQAVHCGTFDEVWVKDLRCAPL